MIDYNKASVTYDDTRNADEIILNEFNLRVNLKTSKIMDFGCGTGNYIKMIFDFYGSRVCGIEPSDGMREKAVEKNPGYDIRKGNHCHMPFDDNTFDFIYMTDVIHHVPDLDSMFSEFKRILKFSGYICINTQSWSQIEARWYNCYFKSLAENEKKRYPDVSLILDKAARAGLAITEVKIILSDTSHIITEDFIQNAEEKNYSMFRMITEEELKCGINKMKKDIGREVVSEGSGETLIWIRKE